MGGKQSKWLLVVVSLGLAGCGEADHAAQAELTEREAPDTGERDAATARPRVEPSAAAARTEADRELARTTGEDRGRVRVRLYEEYADAIASSGRSDADTLAEAIELRRELLGTPEAESDLLIQQRAALARGEVPGPTPGDLEMWARPPSREEQAVLDEHNRQVAERMARDSRRALPTYTPSEAELEGARLAREMEVLGPVLAAERRAERGGEACHAH